jgi:hypothetical protein
MLDSPVQSSAIDTGLTAGNDLADKLSKIGPIVGSFGRHRD